MSSVPSADAENRPVHREYALGVHISEVREAGADAEEPRYRFEAPRHEGATFPDADDAELYVDVYFDANGFQETGTGDRGVPPEVIQAGRDTLAAYFLAQPYADREWVASFFGRRPDKIARMVDGVRARAAEVREGVEKREDITERGAVEERDGT